MPKLYAFRRFFRDEVELAAFDDAKFQDGLVIARRGNEVFQLYVSSFEPLGDLTQDKQWEEEEKQLKAELLQIQQREQRKIIEGNQKQADKWEEEQVRNQDDVDELRHSLADFMRRDDEQ